MLKTIAKILLYISCLMFIITGFSQILFLLSFYTKNPFDPYIVITSVIDIVFKLIISVLTIVLLVKNKNLYLLLGLSFIMFGFGVLNIIDFINRKQAYEELNTYMFTMSILDMVFPIIYFICAFVNRKRRHY